MTGVHLKGFVVVPAEDAKIQIQLAQVANESRQLTDKFDQSKQNYVIHWHLFFEKCDQPRISKKKLVNK